MPALCCIPLGGSLDLHPVARFLYHVSPALVTVVLGALIVQRFFVSRANEAALIDTIETDLDQLRADALEYWNLEPTTKRKRDRASVLEQKIKGATKSLNSDLKYYAHRYNSKTDFEALMMEVSDACTGGSFESATRTIEAGRYITIVNTVSRIKSELRRRKL